ncbi:MAG: RDD family protein [Steroidobacteraceae bacterium]
MIAPQRTWLRYAAAACGCLLLTGAARAADEPSYEDSGSHISIFTVRENTLDCGARGARCSVSIGHDAMLEKGETADTVVTIFGSSTVAGDVTDSVVAVFGDARVTGTVGNGAVAVLGNVYVDSKVDGNVVSVLGDVTLGPQAEVSGQVVDVLGTLHRDPAAVIEGGIESVPGLDFGDRHGMQAWVRHCLFYGRLLGLTAGLSWAWGFALAALVFYLLLAALFGNCLARCVRTLDTRPGRSILAALIAVMLSPVLYLVLLVTIVGIVFIPFVWAALFFAGLFGKAVALAWVGEHCLRRPPTASPARAHVIADVLVGGIILLGLYLIPVIGFAAFALLGLWGFGGVLYTLILATNETRESARPAAFAGPVGGASAAGPAPAGPSSPPPAQTPPPVAEVSPDESTYARAGFWIRIAALLLDALLVGIVLSVLHNVLRIELLWLAAYGAVMWKLKGTTVGGIVCDLKVVRLDGRPIDWGTAVVRALGCFLSLAAVGLGFVWIALDPERQAWHDKIAGTVVVRVPRGVPLL